MPILPILASMMLAAAPDAPSGGVLVEIEVFADPVYTISHTIVISAERPGLARSRAELSQQRWIAVRTSERGEDRISSEECPALQAAALSFGGLPMLSPAETAANAIATADGSLPIPPTIKDGFWTRLRFRTGDGTLVQTTSGFAYAAWANQTVGELLRCWSPLTPTASPRSAPETSPPRR